MAGWGGIRVAGLCYVEFMKDCVVYLVSLFLSISCLTPEDGSS